MYDNNSLIYSFIQPEQAHLKSRGEKKKRTQKPMLFLSVHLDPQLLGTETAPPDVSQMNEVDVTMSNTCDPFTASSPIIQF